MLLQVLKQWTISHFMKHLQAAHAPQIHAKTYANIALMNNNIVRTLHAKNTYV